MKKIIILLFIAVSLFAQFKFQRSLPDRYTVFLLGKSYNGSNTFKDYSQYNNTITTYGDTKQLSTQYKFDNGAIYFDGSGDYLNSTIGDLGNFGTGDFTIDLWVYPLGDQNGGYIGQGSSPVYGSNYGWLVDESFSIGHKFRFVAYTTSWGNIVVDPNTITDNQWYHVAVIRYGNTVKLYKNGISVATYNATGKTFRKGTDILNIGCMYNGGYSPEKFYGQYFRITKGIARWTSNFTPPNKPY